MQYCLKSIFLILMIAIYIIPGYVSCRLLLIEKLRKNVKNISLIYVLNLLFAIVLHYFLRGYWNVAHTARQLYNLEWSYSEINDLTSWLSGCICFALLLVIGTNKFRKIEKNRNKNNNQSIFLMFSVSIIVLVCGYIFSEQGNRNIVINEVSSNNQKIYLAEYDSYCDYIEIYNRGTMICEIDNLYLSDDKENLKKIKLSGGDLRPGEFLVYGLDKEKSLYYIQKDAHTIWYSDEDVNIENEKGMFSILNAGEYIYLSDSNGNILDSVYTEAQEESTALCRLEDGGKIWGLRSSTPGETNQNAELLKVIDAPKLSHKSGVYNEEFELTIDSHEGTKVYYTVDGSEPDENSMEYEKKIRIYDKSSEDNRWRSIQNVVLNWKEYVVEEEPIDKAFIIKAIAIDEDGAKSSVVQATYLFDQEKYNDKKIVSITANPEDLFGEFGICVTGKYYDDWYLFGGDIVGGSIVGSSGERALANFEKRGRISEIEATLEYIDDSIADSQKVGMRIQGGSARYEAIKRFAIYARKEYGGSKWFIFPWFDGMKTHAVNLRPGFANAVMQQLVSDRDVAIQNSIPVEVFLNGEYWYSAYIQERYTKSFFAEKFGLQEDAICIVESGIAEDESLISNGNEEIYAYINSHDLSIDDNYREFCEIVDIDSYIDFLCINMYLANMDWCENKNYITWKSIPDGKWRWALYDLDSVDPLVIEQSQYYKGIEEWAQINPFIQKGEFVDQSLKETQMYAALRKNDEFCKKMILRFCDLMNTNFSIPNVTFILEEWGEDITWNDSFFVKRPEYMCRYIEEEFEDKNINLNIKEGGTQVVVSFERTK